jgi:hypothetical protein
MDCYNISLHGFFLFLWIFFLCFFKMIFLDFIFFILSWLRILLRSFLKKNIVDCYNVSPHGFCFATVFPHFFFQNYLCWIFFYIELVKNLALTFLACFISHFFFLFLFAFFSKLSSSFYFFLCFFSELFLLILIFLILSWLRI